MYKSTGTLWEEKKEKTLPEKLKNFFGFSKPGGPNQQLQWKPKPIEFPLSKDILIELGPQNTLAVRLKAMKDLYETVLTKHLEDKTLEALVVNTEDLVNPQQSLEARHTVLKFYNFLIQGQFEKLANVRAYFFRLLKNHTVLEDLSVRLELFKALTDCGKVILYFEEETGPFLLEWMPSVISSGKTQDFLVILVNFIKYNAAYLDSDVITGLIQHACVLSGRTKIGNDIDLCLDMMDALICYSSLPSEVLPHFIISLCRTINIEQYSRKSWKVMRHYLGTSMGQSGIFTICLLIQERNLLSDYAFLRGAVFILRLALWGENKVTTLSPLLTGVLPSLLQSLDALDSYVAFEVVSCVQDLITSSDRSRLQHVTWEILLRIIDKLLSNPEVLCAAQTSLGEKVHEALTTIERLHKENLFVGYPDQLFDVVDRFASRRPECSVMGLIDYRSKSIHPKHEDWIDKLNYLLEKYFKLDTRSSIRVKVLCVLEQVVRDHRHLYEKEFIEESVLKFLSRIEIDPDLQARIVAVRFLIELAVDCHEGRCCDLLDVIGKVLCRQFVSSHSSFISSIDPAKDSNSEEELIDVQIAAEGLIHIFKSRLKSGPPNQGIHAFNRLIGYLQQFYNTSFSLEETPTIRKNIFTFLLSIRSNELCQLWVTSNNGLNQPSSNMFCTSDQSECSKSYYGTSSPPPLPLLSPTSTSSSSNLLQNSHLNFKSAFKVIVTSLKEEKDWLVILLLLQELPKLLSNKSIVICGGNTLTSLCTTLCNLVLNVVIDKYNHIPLRFTKLDFQMYIYPILAKMAAYHSEISTPVQRILINCLLQGLVSKCVCSCIVALTLCTLQMQDIMYKMLPDVLLRLSKISATVTIAVPVLEFLSNLIRHARLYKSFVEDQYMSIFAIALPYTNPSKFHQYTVALAHHVIAMWFIKCRQPFRKDFVRYIMNGLRANVGAPFEDNPHYGQQQQQQQQQHATPDGTTSRQRSGSLHEAHPKKIDWSSPPQHRSNSLFSNNVSSSLKTNKAIKTLHQELLETSLDLFGRYCFMTLPNLPKRDELSEFLMDKGLSDSWLVGSSLVTITTSSPGINSYKDGLCKECYIVCHPGHVPEPDLFSNPISERKRHKSEIQPSTRDRLHLHHLPFLTKDDLLIHHQNTKTEIKPLTIVPQTETQTTTEESKTKKEEARVCNCWCPGWVEILVRRPTGNYSSLMRIQHSTADFPVPDFRNWFNLEESFGLVPEAESTLTQNDQTREIKPGLCPINSESLKPDDIEMIEGEDEDLSSRSKSPLRRTSSSPDMQCSWPTQHAVPVSYNSPATSPPSNPNPNSPPPNPPLENANQENGGTKNAAQSKSSPSSPLARQSVLRLNSVEEMSGTSESELEVQKDAGNSRNNSFPGSPRKEDKFNSIPEEKCVGRVKLKLDLTGVNHPASGVFDSSKVPPHTAPIKSKVPPKSPFSKRMGSTSPPPSSSSSSSKSSFFRDRTHTISVVSPVSPSKRSPVRSASFASRTSENTAPRDGTGRMGLHPSFVFLQLSQTTFPAGAEPLLLPKTDMIERAVKMLDLMPPYETHKIGVVYVGPGQVNNEAAILSNRFGSVRYKDFLCSLGTFLQLKQVDPRFTYVGGLDLKGQDGNYACSWQDDIMQVIFHVATLIPNRDSDPSSNHKKCHIGNDFVTIVYNNSGQDFSASTLKGQFIYVCIIIEPNDFGTSIVSIKAKPELAEILGHLGPSLISDEFLSVYARQLALHANLASVVTHREQSASCLDSYITNRLERLRQLKRLKDKVLQELAKDDDEFSDSPKQSKDFTSYV